MRNEIAVLEDTLRIFEEGKYKYFNEVKELKLSREQQKTTKVLLEKEVHEIVKAVPVKEEATMDFDYSCRFMDSFSLAQEKIEDGFEKVLVLNMANATHIGGGVRRGAVAQEEDLCRRSSLLVSLESDNAYDYYEFNRTRDQYLSSDSVIITPEVEVIKGERNNYLEDSFIVSVITCAAPVFRSDVKDIPFNQYKMIMSNRVKAMLSFAAHEGYKNLILGAFGCGAFGNDAALVSDVFKDILSKYDFGFESVDFAILAKKDMYNFIEFNRNFGTSNLAKANTKYEFEYETVIDDKSNTANDSDMSYEFESSVTDLDKWDYTISAASGMLTAALDILFVKELNIATARETGEKDVEELVKKMAKKKGYKGDSVSGAIAKLEKAFPLPSDKLTSDFGGGLQHHLRDFVHHPTLLGLIFSILSQFTGYGFGTDTDGNFIIRKLPDDSGIGATVPEKIVNGTLTWAFHLISDMAGSSGALNGGTGIPGPLLAFFKEVSSLPLVKDVTVQYEKKNKTEEISVSACISKLFNGTYFAEYDENGRMIKDSVVPFDFRTEIGVAKQISKQAMPVIVNECIIRTFYMVRRMYLEAKDKGVERITDIRKMNPRNFLPWSSKTITRMITVSTGIFNTIVVSKAAVKAAMASKGNNIAFATSFLLNINYPGIVRFTISCSKEIQYISEDIIEKCRNDLNRRAWNRSKWIENVPAMNYTSLSSEEARVMYSLEYRLTEYDIGKTKSITDKLLKKEWLREWTERKSRELSVDESYFLEDSEIYANINGLSKEYGDRDWLYIIAAELIQFKPYYMFDKNSHKQYKKLKTKSDYITDIFTSCQNEIRDADIKELAKLISYYEKELQGNSTAKTAAKVAISIAIPVVTGGAGMALAPVIAPIIAGPAVAGLSGAALTSASLAFVGGGSIAAGGLGMAGGTAVITGGGAILGAIGSTTANAVDGMKELAKMDYCKPDLAKLLAIMNYVLIKKNNDIDTAKYIKRQFGCGINNLFQLIAEAESKKQYSTSKEERKHIDEEISGWKHGITVIKNCCTEIDYMIRRNFNARDAYRVLKNEYPDFWILNGTYDKGVYVFQVSPKYIPLDDVDLYAPLYFAVERRTGQVTNLSLEELKDIIENENLKAKWYI